MSDFYTGFSLEQTRVGWYKYSGFANLELVLSIIQLDGVSECNELNETTNLFNENDHSSHKEKLMFSINI